jgi:hypothetical protein
VHALHTFLTDWRVEMVLSMLIVVDVIFVIVSINLELAYGSSLPSLCPASSRSSTRVPARVRGRATID